MTREMAYSMLMQAYNLLEEVARVINAEEMNYTEVERRQIQTARQETAFALQNLEAAGV